jgi:hypothetical protein
MTIIYHIFSISGYGIYPGTALWLERFAKGRLSKALAQMMALIAEGGM